MNHSRLLKTVLAVGCVATIIAAVITPRVEGYGDFIARIALVSLSLFLLVYCLYAYKAGEVNVRGFVSKRSESSGHYWFGILIYFVFAIVMLVINFVQLYT